MRKASAPTLFLVGLLVLVAVGGITFGVGSLAGLGDDDDEASASLPEATTPTSDPSLRADQVVVTGLASNVTIDGAVLDGLEVAVPTVTTPSAGLGSGARFEDVVVDGEPAAIAWDAGRPLAFDPDTPLRLLPTVVNLAATPQGIAVGFPDDVALRLVPGDYEIDAPVAVTTTGLGSPRDSVTFTATEATTVAFSGLASGVMAVQPVSALGPGRVLLQGVFLVRSPDGTSTPARSVELPSGSFRMAFSPTPDGLTLSIDDALLEGAVVLG